MTAQWYKNPRYVMTGILKRLPLHWMKDEAYLRMLYRLRFGKALDLDDPKTFNEKVQWLKLHDRRPEYTVMVDKYAAKQWVADRIGEQYIIPTLGIWEHFDEIDFDKLPEQFVLKCTHDSGGLVICRDKSGFDRAAAKKKINKCLKRNYYWPGREWCYKNVKPRILAEQYMESPGLPVPEDYKIYCMNGEPKYIVVFHNRFNPAKPLQETVYDTDWQRQPFSLDEHFAISDRTEPRPKCLAELLRITKVLCADIPQVRVDFYIIHDSIYFGEITLYTASGLQKMIPEEMDQKVGEMLQLTRKMDKASGGGTR